MKQKNVWIYCRVADENEYELLHFQAELLQKYADKNNFDVLSLRKELDPGTSMHSNKILPLVNAIVDGFVDAVLVYSKDRLFCYDDVYTEFELLCLMHNVSIITYKDVEHL